MTTLYVIGGIVSATIALYGAYFVLRTRAAERRLSAELRHFGIDD